MSQKSRILRTILLVVVALFVGIQFVPVDRSNPAVSGEIAAPAPVQTLLERACYDCHSNETEWPWYSHVAPASWLIAADVEDGRGELNFSEWQSMPTDRKSRKLEELGEEVGEGGMPLRLYGFAHRKARLSETERDEIVAWAELERQALLAESVPSAASPVPAESSEVQIGDESSD